MYCRENTVYISGTGNTVDTTRILMKIVVSNTDTSITVSKINLNFESSVGFFNGPFFYYGGDNGGTAALMSFKGSRSFCGTATNNQYQVIAATGSTIMMRVAQLDLDADLSKVEFSDSCIHHNAPAAGITL